MYFLALDTSTEACSAAVYAHGKIYSRFILAQNTHSAHILQLCEQVIQQAGIEWSQLNAIASSCGPGSFTGLRIGIGLTQGIAFAHDLPVIQVSSLMLLAQGAYYKFGATRVISAIDARMGEVYWGAFELNQQQHMQLIGIEQVSAPEQVKSVWQEEALGVGSAWSSYGPSLQQSTGMDNYHGDFYPHAHTLAAMAPHYFQQGEVRAATTLEAVYLRNQVAKKATPK